MDLSALGHTGELAEPFTGCAFPSVKSIFGLEPHTFYELLREMAPGLRRWNLNRLPFPKSGAVHFGNSQLHQLLP